MPPHTSLAPASVRGEIEESNRFIKVSGAKKCVVEKEGEL